MAEADPLPRTPYTEDSNRGMRLWQDHKGRSVILSMSYLSVDKVMHVNVN